MEDFTMSPVRGLFENIITFIKLATDGSGSKGHRTRENGMRMLEPVSLEVRVGFWSKSSVREETINERERGGNTIGGDD